MSTTAVETALRLPPEEIGRALLELPETQWFERRSGRIKPRDAAETAVAFANAEGGVLVIGASNGKIDGITPEQLNGLQQMAHDHTEPPVPARVEVVQSVPPEAAEISPLSVSAWATSWSIQRNGTRPSCASAMRITL